MSRVILDVVGDAIISKIFFTSHQTLIFNYITSLVTCGQWLQILIHSVQVIPNTRVLRGMLCSILMHIMIYILLMR
jgi:hypothetical protein